MTNKKLFEKIEKIKIDLLNAAKELNEMENHLYDPEEVRRYATRAFVNQALRELKRLKKKVTENICLYL